MVGLSDIPCVGKALDRISDAVVEKVYRGLCYMLCYRSFVNNLEFEIKKIEVHEGRVSKRVDEERANGKTIENHVTEWQTQVQEIKTSADDLCKQRPSNCLNIVPIPNPVSRFRIGRKAAHEAKNVADLTLSGEKLLEYEIAYPPADENLPITDTTYQKFESRDPAYKMLWGALVKEDGHPIIGIHGMPGVGKTRMMEKSWNDAKDKKIFAKVARANVGAGEINVLKLQKELAGYLGCHLDSPDNEELRASQLKESFKSGGKTLVVLDDVWGSIPLERIGIPIGGNLPKCFKVLLTSRKDYVCQRNGCKDPIKVNALMDDEAWDMFEVTVGASKINSLRDTSLAGKVCKECGGLPLLILALGNALKFQSEDSWKHALSQLENCEFDEIDDIERQVYTCICLSLDMLRNDTRTCLLLASLFPEDAGIEIMMLADLATGSGLVNRGGNIRGLVDNLKGSSLLLEGKSRDTFKMHDVIRDVARSVAARDQKYAFLFVTGARHLPLVDDYRSRKLIQFVESRNFGRLTDMVCPNLHTLWLECNNQPQQFSDSIFIGMDNLKLLIIKGMCIFPEKMAVETFDKLTTLMLEGCDIKEMWLSVSLGNLETLRISDCRLPHRLDFSMMKSLRKLQLLSDEVIEMVPNAISSLSATLAELRIPTGFRIFDAKGNRRVPISSEINKLTALTNLNISLDNSESSLPDQHIVANLLDFSINVDDKFINFFDGSETRSVFFDHTYMEGGREHLAEIAEEVNLLHLKGSPNGLSNINGDSYSNLKKLSINSCGDMEHLFGVPQLEIQQSQPATPFSKITSLTIRYCSRLKYVFPVYVAKCLLQLEELLISECDELELVIWNKIATDGDIIFPKLKSLVLKDNKRLQKFCESTDADSPSRSDSLFNGTVEFPNLEELFVERCHKLTSVFLSSTSTAKNLLNLKELVVNDCHSMSEIIGEEGKKEKYDEIVFPELTKLVLTPMPTFKNMTRSKLVLTPMPTFKNIIIINEGNDDSSEVTTAQQQSSSAPKLWFPKLENFEFHMSSTLEGIRLGRNDSTSEIRSLVVWCRGEVQLPSQWQLQLPNIEELHLKNSWWHESSYLMNSYGTVSFQRLKQLEVNSCGVSALFSCSVFRNLHQLQELIVKYCPLLEEVVRDDNKIPDTQETTISLLQLKSIKLSNLPKLKSFNISAKYSFNMPALTSVALKKCTRMGKFTCLELRAPLIQDFDTQFQQYQSRQRYAANIR